MVKTPDFERAREYAVQRLEHELSPYLAYHSVDHTVKEVVPAAEILTKMEKLDVEESMLLLTAAYYHDLGFIYQRQGHEAISIRLAEENLPGFGYSEAQVAAIRAIIQATCLPQSPTNYLENIMADADLDYLGHEDYWRRSEDFRRELDHFGKSFSDEEWYFFQLNFMQNHQYFTKAERELRDSIKQQHILEVMRLLDEVKQLK